MKKIFLLFTIVCMAFMSCTDDLVGGSKMTANLGDEIQFGGSMKYESAKKIGRTRTVYGDKVETGTEIKWHAGDIVGIYCAQAYGDVKYCDYTVVDPFPGTGQITGNGDDDAYEECSLSPQSDNYLRWGEGNHTFYGVYPSALMLNKYGEDADVASSLKLENGTLTASLPNIQRPGSYVTADANENYTTHPAMRYAYMVATASTDPSKDATVLLQFNPIVTAVEITLENTGTAPIEGITMVSLSSDNELCGSFTADLSSAASSAITLTSSGDTYKTIQVPLVEAGSSINLPVGKTITFTAFMMLNTDLSSIKLTLLYAGGVAQKQATLTGNKTDANQNGIIVKAKTKNFIKNVPLSFSNAVSSVDLSRWAASISTKDDKTLASLSIPAAGGAASGHTTDWSSNEKYLEQELTIDELWDNGIRCFEFTVDYDKSTSGTTNLGGLNVYCNSKNCNITLQEAVSKVKAKLLANPTEFAMVIITYQQNDGWDKRNQDNSGGAVTYTRKPGTFMSQLNTFWSNVTDGSNTVTGSWGSPQTVNTVDGQITITPGTALYSPTTTLSNARGKLFCIARPISEDEDNYKTINGSNINGVSQATYPSYTIGGNIFVIEGWGAMKDKWERRGYTSCPFYRGNGNDFFNGANKTRIGYTDNRPGRPFDVASNNDNISTITDSYVDDNLETLLNNVNFTYTVKNSSGTISGISAYVHEWARVSNIEGQFDGTTETGADKEYFWPNSTKEKLSHVKNTLDLALGNQSGNVLYINSLCGYFIDATDNNSYLPNSLTDMSGHNQSLIITSYPRYTGLSGASQTAGMCGNISDYALWVNNAFYQYLLTKNLGGNSTGIIMMDRVSDDAVNNPAGYYIPRIILANNPFAPGQVGGGASYSIRKDQDLEEGDNWFAPAKRSSHGEDDEFSIVWE